MVSVCFCVYMFVILCASSSMLRVLCIDGNENAARDIGIGPRIEFYCVSLSLFLYIINVCIVFPSLFSFLCTSLSLSLIRFFFRSFFFIMFVYNLTTPYKIHAYWKHFTHKKKFCNLNLILRPFIVSNNNNVCSTILSEIYSCCIHSVAGRHIWNSALN